MNIAIVGATGNVGRKLIEVLEKKKFPVTEAHLVASPNSAGKKIHFLGKEHTVINLEEFDFSKPSPLLGEHTNEILTELNFGRQKIESLKCGKIVRDISDD